MSGERQDVSDPEIRAIIEGELDAWVRAHDASYLLPTPEGALAFCREFYAPDRSLGVFSAGRCVGTFRGLDLEVTVPGGAAVRAEGITNVSVIPDQRRRGLLSRMMRAGLDNAVARRKCLAVLLASEYRIYGRFGFGPATSTAGYDIDVRRAGGIRAPAADGGGVGPLALHEVRRYGPGLYERFRRRQPGAITRDQAAWRMCTGALRNPYRREWTERTAVLYRGADGAPTGMAVYHADGRWRDGDPDYTLTVDDVVAADPPAAAALWRHLLNVEWVARVMADNVAPDDPLPLLLDNPRACVPRAGAGEDHLWLRILDVARALEERTYEAPGRLVLDVTDRMGYASGRFALEAGHDGRGRVTAVSEPAELALDVSTLGTIYLGDQTVHRLATAGLVTEQCGGAVSRADRMLRTAVRPWCPDSF